MPQWRKLHVKTVDSLDVAAMPDDFTRLMWTYLPLCLDSEGRGIDNARWLRSKLFPLREDVSDEMVCRSMTWVAARGMIERYEVGGRAYFHVPTFHEYQGKTDREAPSRIPAPVKRARRSRSRPTHDQLMSRSTLDVDVEEKRVESAPNGAHAAEPVRGPSPIAELEARFCALSGLPRPSPRTKSEWAEYTKLWSQPLTRLHDLMHATAPEILAAVIPHMQRDGLTVATPKSVEKTAVSEFAKRRNNPPSQRFKDAN